MVAVGDHIRVTDHQALVGIDADIINVYYYRITGVTGSPTLQESGSGLKAWFYTDFIPDLLQLQVTTLVHQNILVESIENWEAEFINVEPDSAVTGIVSGGYSSSATAWSFTLLRTLRTTRNGSKRYAGVPESQANDNVPTASASSFALAWAINLGQGWTVENDDGSGFSMVPVIAKTPTPPATLPSVFNDILGVQFRGLGSQNTRKRLIS